MSRKKMVKRSATKNQTAKNSEKDFSQTSEALIQQLGKEIVSLRKQEAQQKKALVNAKTVVGKTSQQIKAVAKVKTATAKKRLAAAKKANLKASKAQAIAAKELAATQSALAAAQQKQAKLQALRKVISQFEAEWLKKSKKTAIKKPKTRKKKSRSTASLAELSSAADNIESFEAALESHALEEETAKVA